MNNLQIAYANRGGKLFCATTCTSKHDETQCSGLNQKTVFEPNFYNIYY